MIEVEFYEKENGWSNHTIWDGKLAVLPKKGEMLTGNFLVPGPWIVKNIRWYFGTTYDIETNQTSNYVKVLILCRKPYFWEY